MLYLTHHVVEVVGAAGSILEEGGIRRHVPIQQAIEKLKSEKKMLTILDPFPKRCDTKFDIHSIYSISELLEIMNVAKNVLKNGK